jgi:hypothetical protein
VAVPPFTAGNPTKGAYEANLVTSLSAAAMHMLAVEEQPLLCPITIE